MKSEGSKQLFHTRVFDLHGCPHVGFIQSWDLVGRGIVQSLLSSMNNRLYWTKRNLMYFPPADFCTVILVPHFNKSPWSLFWDDR